MKEYTHADRLGQDIKIGSIIAVPVTRSSIKICRVSKLSPKMISMRNLECNDNARLFDSITFRKYPHEVIVLDKMEETLLFLLSRGI